MPPESNPSAIQKVENQLVGNEITINPKTAKNRPTYSQGTKLSIFNIFWDSQ